MPYYFTKKVTIDFQEAIERVTSLLKEQGFGVLTEIDVKETLKKKIDADFQPYKILGACNPQFAYKALSSENKIGTMLPCNVIVQKHPDGVVEVSAIDPIASMMAIDNKELAQIATEVSSRLKKVIESL